MPADKADEKAKQDDRLFVGILIVLAVGVRLFIWYQTEASFLGDMIHYVEMAKNLGEGRILDTISPLACPLYPS